MPVDIMSDLKTTHLFASLHLTSPCVSRSRRRCTTATAVTTTELRLESARSTTLLLAALLSSSVATIATVASGTTTASWSVVTTHHASRGSVASLLLDVSGRDNLSREVEPFSEVVETFWGQGVVVVLPRELCLDVSSGSQGLESLDDLFCVHVRTIGSLQTACSRGSELSYIEVLGVDVGVLWKVVVLLGHEYTLLEEVLVDLLAISLWDEPSTEMLAIAQVILPQGCRYVHCHEFQALFGESCTMRNLSMRDVVVGTGEECDLLENFSTVCRAAGALPANATTCKSWHCARAWQVTLPAIFEPAQMKRRHPFFDS